MNFILVVLTVVAGVSPNYERDWRPLGDFANQQLCEDAARQLNVGSARFRCIRSQ
jgi:hypothetical protein